MRTHVWMHAFLAAGVALAAAEPGNAALVNGSFETDALAPNSLCISYASPLCASLTGWTGEIYLVRGATTFLSGPQPLPDGQQFAMLQATNQFRQTVTLASAGTYELTWWDAGRGGFGGNQSYDVSFDGSVLGSFSTSTNSQWIQHSLVFTASAGAFTLELTGKVPFSQGDQSALFDDFRLQPIVAPEPTVFALGVGALATLAARRRRRR